MDSFARAQRDWETPPDEEEAVVCEDCGQDERVKSDFSGKIDFTFCDNLMCPGKFEVGSIEREMAEKLVDTLDTVSRLEGRVKHLTRLIRIYDPEYK